MDPRASGRELGSASPCGAGSRCYQLPRRTLAVLPQHPDEHRSERPVLLTVDQQLGEGATLRVAPELSDPVGRARSREASGRGAARRGERGRGHPGAPGGGAQVHPVSWSQLSRRTVAPLSACLSNRFAKPWRTRCDRSSAAHREAGSAGLHRATGQSETTEVIPETRYGWNGDVALAYQVVGSGPPDLLYLPGVLSKR